MTKANWHIRNIDEEYQRQVRAHAAYRDVTVTQMLEIIISDWTEQNKLTMTKETNENRMALPQQLMPFPKENPIIKSSDGAMETQKPPTS